MLYYSRLSVLACMAVAAVAAENHVNAQLPWQKVMLDSQKRLLAWYEPNQNLGYDKVMRLAWDFMEHKVPKDTRHGSGLKIYLINAVFDDTTLQGYNWQGNPASLFGQFVDSLVAWYPYSGDQEAVAVVRAMLDYQLAHGTTPADWNWANVPFATNCDDEPQYGKCLQDMPREFYGGIETDKVGELGIGYALFYEMTGESQYLEAAKHCGEALAKHVRTGDADHTPWPFRVNAKTGEVLGQEQFGGMTVAPVRLLDELVRLKSGDVSHYQKARDIAWKWIVEYPLNSGSPAYDKWSGYFEDVPFNPKNVNQALPTMTAYYILSRTNPAAVDEKWELHVGHLIDWVRERFGRGPYLGAWAIDEQGEPGGGGCCSRAGLASDTSRWGAINAMYYERTGDSQAHEDAFRSLNYATYFAGSDGRISCCGQGFDGQYWFDDGYGDYIRNYMWAIGAVPEFAPIRENHLLRSSSIVQKVTYGNRRIDYRTFDSDSVEVLRMNFAPARVTAGGTALPRRTDANQEGYTIQNLANGDYVVRIRHVNSQEVSIS